jgi:poly(A) polymerase Pap1
MSTQQQLEASVSEASRPENVLVQEMIQLSREERMFEQANFDNDEVLEKFRDDAREITRRIQKNQNVEDKIWKPDQLNFGLQNAMCEYLAQFQIV